MVESLRRLWHNLFDFSAPMSEAATQETEFSAGLLRTALAESDDATFERVLRRVLREKTTIQTEQQFNAFVSRLWECQNLRETAPLRVLAERYLANLERRLTAIETALSFTARLRSRLKW